MKGGKGLGCSICGSRWHQTSSCPVGGSKGGSKGHPKGYGSTGGKGKKGAPRYKGKGKWVPRFKGGKSKGKGKGKSGKGYYGYASKALIHSFNETKAATPERPARPKVVHFKLDGDDEQPILNLQRARDDEARQDTAAASTGPIEKKLDFTFATAIYSSNVSYHTVRGETGVGCWWIQVRLPDLSEARPFAT